MVKQTSSTIVREIDKLSESETQAVAQYISRLLSQRISKQFEASAAANDDLIVSLSDKRENERARQVIEWERIRRRNVLRAA